VTEPMICPCCGQPVAAGQLQRDSASSGVGAAVAVPGGAAPPAVSRELASIRLAALALGAMP